MNTNKRFVWQTRPLALPTNIVEGNTYRFTVLTPSLLRLEYSPNGVFEDRPSQSVFYRDFPENHYTVTRTNGFLYIETEKLLLSYLENSAFDSDTLCIRLKDEPASCWHYGEDFEDLGGTVKTLDLINGKTPLERGVISRNGFSVMDDSHTMLLNEQGWVEVRTPGTTDCYFWGYGFRYLEAVQDLYRLTGIPPLLPDYALGNWWSRFYTYTQQEYQDLILKFEEKQLPFSVSVVDMDWHIVKIPEECKKGENRFENGWTGYTWNEELFPDYRGFLQFLKKHNMKTALNLHPAQGIGCHEIQYPQMAKACGIDPETKERVRFDLLSQSFMEKYFDILHHPYEDEGVDFWWMDWQQGQSYWWIHEENKDGVLQDEREILDPLWMLNHLHILDISRNGKRPMFFSRYSGIGSQRYPVGFSGDTIITWDSLDFQPYFTATASNVGYGWWSHDIGGHMGGYRDDALCTRWLQLGVFSPITRLHSCNIEFIRREPWLFEPKIEQIMSDWLRLRHRLFPYLYTMNYRNHTQLLPLVQPMYYHYPKVSASYAVKNQFMFGSELMVAPITTPNSSISQMGSVDVWFPKGDWFDFFTGLHYTSTKGRVLNVNRGLEQYPVFAKAGAIVPMHQGHTLKAGADLEVRIFPGADNQFTLYEDAGDGSAYQDGEYVITQMNLCWNATPVFTLQPAKGDLSLLPTERTYRFVLQGFHPCVQVQVLIDGEVQNTSCFYDWSIHALVTEVTASTASEIQLCISGAQLITDNGSLVQRCVAVLQSSQFSVQTKEDVMRMIKENKDPMELVLRRLAFLLSSSPEIRSVLNALTEQLTLTEFA